MALKGFDLFLVHEINNFRTFRYDTLDTIATVEAAGYFTRVTDHTHFDDELVRFEVGDEVQVYVWSTTIRTGTFVSKAQYRVTAVTTAGVATIAVQVIGNSGQIIIGSGLSGATASTNADELILEGSSLTGISILTPNNTKGIIYFADPQSSTAGAVEYSHAANTLSFRVNGVGDSLIIDANQNILINGGSTATSAAGTLHLPIDTSPSAALVGGIVIGSKDSSAGSTDATLELWLETAPVTVGTFTESHKVPVWINGTEYHIVLDAV